MVVDVLQDGTARADEYTVETLELAGIIQAALAPTPHFPSRFPCAGCHTPGLSCLDCIQRLMKERGR